MEAHRQGFGYCHKAALAIGLHIVLLATDIHDDFLGLWSMDAEVGTTLLIYFGEIVPRDGSLGCDGIFGN